MFTALTAKYLQLDKYFGLQIVRTSEACLKAFDVLSFPTLVKEDGTKLNSVQAISYEFSQRVNLDEVLFGEDQPQQNNIAKHFDMVSMESEKLKELYQKQLSSRTFLEDNHITIADLVAMCSFYFVIKNWTDEQKFENNHIFRWYNHMQNLTGVKENWEGEHISFPQRVEKVISKAQLKTQQNEQRKLQNQYFMENKAKAEAGMTEAPAPAPKVAEKKPEAAEKKPEAKPEAKKEQAKPAQGENKPEGGNAKKGKGGGGHGPKGGKAKPVKGSPEELFEQFANLELRIGSLEECWKHPESEKLWCEKINIGREVREIASGLQKHCPLETMVGQVIVASNLKPKKLAGFPSNGMVMCASIKQEGNEQIEILRPAQGTVVGERVFLEGLELEDRVMEFASNKLLERLFPHLKTDAEGYACFNGKRMMTKAGPLSASSLKNGTVS